MNNVLQREPPQWSRVSIVIISETLSASDFSRILSVPSVSTKLDRWVGDFEGGGGLTVMAKIESAMAFLADRADVLRPVLSKGDLQLFVRWSPAPSQDGIGFSVTEVAVLADLGGRILLDTHVDEVDYDLPSRSN